MHLVVRLDITTQLGTGHWRRMCNLLDAMPGTGAVFAVRTDNRENRLFADRSVQFLPDERGAETLGRICDAEQTDLVILDLLKYPPGFVQRVKDVTRRKTVTFHEYSDWNGASDLAVNYNTFDGFETASSSRVLAGPRYCILNRALLSGVRSPKPAGVVVTFGGSDPSGFGSRFVERVASQLPKIPFTIHTGPFAAAIASPGSLPDNVRLTGPKDCFFDLLLSARVGVTAAGNSMYEMIYLGLMPLVLAHNEHQAGFARNAARLKTCVYCGDQTTVDWDRLAELIGSQYNDPPQPPQRLIDGMGAQRIVERLMALTE